MEAGGSPDVDRRSSILNSLCLFACSPALSSLGEEDDPTLFVTLLCLLRSCAARLNFCVLAILARLKIIFSQLLILHAQLAQDAVDMAQTGQLDRRKNGSIGPGRMGGPSVAVSDGSEYHATSNLSIFI